MTKTTTAVWLSAVCVLMTATMLGCGKKGDPTPVGTQRHRPVVALKLGKTPGAVTVRWLHTKRPGLSTVFKLERSESNLREKDCPTCPQSFETITDIDASGPLCKQGDPVECMYTDRQVKDGYQYTYRLKTCDDTDRCDGYTPSAKINY